MQSAFSRAFGGVTRTVELTVPEKLPEATIKYLIDYGWKQSLSDAFAAAKDAHEFEGKLRARFDKLVAGTMSEPRTGGTRTTDPVEREVKRLVTIAQAAWFAERKKAGKAKASEELISIWKDRYLELHGEELRAKAETNVAEMAAISTESMEDLLDGLE